MVRERVIELRRQRWPYHAIACKLNLSKSTVGRILQDEGLNRPFRPWSQSPRPGASR